MSDGDFLDGYREALDLMKDELTAARARVKELEEERRQVGVWVELAARALRWEALDVPASSGGESSPLEREEER